MTTRQPTILFEQAQFRSVQCQHRQRVGLIYHNLALGFTQDEFITFCQVMPDTDFTQTCVQLTGVDMAYAEPHRLIRTGHPDSQFKLTKSEFSKLQDGLHQALRRIDLYRILHSQLN